MSIKGLEIGSDIETTNEDTLGGGSFIRDSGLYPMSVDVAYLDKSKAGALSLNLHLRVIEGDNRLVKETLYLTSGDTKGNKNFYINKKTGKKVLLPGRSMGEQIARILTDQPMAQLTPEEKTIKLYDFDLKKEVPTPVASLTEMVGQELLIGLHKCVENKRVESNGKWVDTNNKREFNEIHKVFYPDGFSVTERNAEAEEAVFVNTWRNKFDAEYVNDTFKTVEGSDAAASADALPAAEAAQTGALFNTEPAAVSEQA